ncbi:hypothetical protein LZ55_21025 [Salmonella enterica]|nr:hypothetical protein [Salmonella enterica]EBA3099983.1 hypothetical protein [Salmonella enterica]EBP1708084.1 hypothetical protein [Salmonella enterica]ECI8073285.1 hypothetical protein [Salmonella enterica subsp. enterica]
MFYRDLFQVFGPDPLYKEEEGIAILREQYGIEAPEQIFKQIYCGLSNNSEFQTLYGHLNLKSLKWDLVKLKTAEFTKFGRNATYPDYMLEISEDFNACGSKFCIDAREEVANHWLKFGTWAEPPMFIERSLIIPGESGLHLMEGHTRLGTLLGAIKYKFVQLADTHELYIASQK